jgi:hypothetical protein
LVSLYCTHLAAFIAPLTPVEHLRARIAYNLELVFSYTGVLARPPEIIGPVPEGIRVSFYSRGEVTGPKLRGTMRPVGGDWTTVRRDGVANLDVHATLEVHVRPPSTIDSN